MFAALLLAPPVISLLQINNDFSKTTLVQGNTQEEENDSKVSLKIIFLKKQDIKPLAYLFKLKGPIETTVSNSCLNIYLNPAVPPPKFL